MAYIIFVIRPATCRIPTMYLLVGSSFVRRMLSTSSSENQGCSASGSLRRPIINQSSASQPWNDIRGEWQWITRTLVRFHDWYVSLERRKIKCRSLFRDGPNEITVNVKVGTESRVREVRVCSLAFIWHSLTFQVPVPQGFFLKHPLSVVSSPTSRTWVLDISARTTFSSGYQGTMGGVGSYK